MNEEKRNRFKEYSTINSRPDIMSSRMEYYRHVYQDSEFWYGGETDHLIVYMEQGFGDVIQFLRYIPPVREMVKKLTLHCPKEMHRLIEYQNWDVDLIDKEATELPEHDCHTLSMNLPMVIKKISNKAYLKADPIELEGDGDKFGICWESSMGCIHALKSAPLKYFDALQTYGTLYSLQIPIRDAALLEGGEHINLLSEEIDDFYDTARVIASLDYVVSVDTSVLHLAGAMGAYTLALLPYEADERWEIHKGCRSRWYENVQYFIQRNPGNWKSAFSSLYHFLKTY